MNKTGLVELKDIVASVIILQDEILKEVEVTKMSKLDELINSLCPNGVEFKKIIEICDVSRGKVISKDYIKNYSGNFPVYSSQTENNGELGKISTYDFDGEHITWTTDGANAGSVFYRLGKFSVTNVCGLLNIKNKESVATKFLYYVLSIIAPKYVNKGMGNPKLMSNVMSEITVPLPPLEVQKEIVAILDRFDGLCNDICKGLPAEINARQEQHEYYRDKLLDFKDKEVEFKSIGSLITRITDKGKKSKNINQVYVVSNSRGMVKAEEYRENTVHSEDTSNYILMHPGMFAYNPSRLNIGSIALLKDNSPGLVSPMYVVFSVDENKIIKEYLEYNIKSSFVKNKIDSLKEEGARFRFDFNRWNYINIPIPPIEEQRRIVNILDKFTQLTAELNAELTARRKQYEYYRDKLLTFKRLA